MTWPTQPPPDSRIRVHITDGYAFAADGVDVFIGLKVDAAETRVMAVDSEGFMRLESIEPGVLGHPTFRIQHDFARALLDALLRYYQGASDMHTVRADLLHERGRVDKLTTAIIDLANFRFNHQG